VLGCGVLWTLRLGYADHLAHTDSLANVKHAIELAPGNAAYYARWAAINDVVGNDPGASTTALESAVALNPRMSFSWMDLGLRAEAMGNLQYAESCLLQAARVDKQYDPRWTLLNYYFRRGDTENFWIWARSASAMVYGDGLSLFRLYWRVTSDSDLILRKAIPDEQAVLTRYLAFLLTDNHLDAIEPVAAMALKRARPEDLAVLLWACDRLLDSNQPRPALRIWSALCDQRLIGYQAPDPERGASLTNEEFGRTPLGHGFDWRLPRPVGVSVARITSLSTLRVDFSGKQPEDCEIISQFLPVMPGADYRLRFRYRTSNIPERTNLRWRVFDANTGAEIAPQSSFLASESPKDEEIVFSAPKSTGLIRLALAYHRALGTTRIEGSIWLQHLKLEFTSRRQG
jgi:tetratricopeptide (TPR) repeat protein